MINTNVIYNEDCLIGMEKLGDKSVDLILTDLPYGVTAAKWDKYVDINKLWQYFERIITDKGATCIAAMNTNRKYIGFEIDENYYNIAKERIEENGKK